MADTAFRTTEVANGQTTERTVKIKNMGFSSKDELRQYLTEMLKFQDGVCALTGIQFNLDGQEGDPQLRASTGSTATVTTRSATSRSCAGS